MRQFLRYQGGGSSQFPVIRGDVPDGIRRIIGKVTFSPRAQRQLEKARSRNWNRGR